MELGTQGLGRARLLLAAVVMVGVGACGPGGPATEDDGSSALSPTSDSSPTSAKNPDEGLPELDSVIALAAAGSRNTHDSIERHIRGCMAEHGFDYIPRPYESVEAQDPTDRWGFLADHDWWTGDAADSAPRATPPPIGMETLSGEAKDAFRFALLGPAASAQPDDDAAYETIEVDGITMRIPAEGCMADAQRDVYGDRIGFLTLAAQLEALQFNRSERVKANPRVASRVAEWVDCMEASGFDLSGTVRLDDVVDATYVLDDARRVEAAPHAVACDQNTHMVAALVRADRIVSRELLKAHENLVVEFAELREAAEERSSG